MPQPPSPSTRAFFAWALGFTFVLQLPAVLAKVHLLPGVPEDYVALAALGGFGPLVAAWRMARREPGGVRALFARLWRGPVGVVWYPVALFGFALVWLGGTAVHRLLGGADPGPWLYLPDNAQQVVAMLLVPVVEEVGWRGHALPQLLRTHGRLPASLLLGVAWAAWHTMMFILQGTDAFTFAVSMVLLVAGSVLFGWLYHHTRGSLLLAILAHVGCHLNNPSHALPGHVAPFVVYTLAVVVAAGLVIALDRRVWQAQDLDRTAEPALRRAA